MLSLLDLDALEALWKERRWGLESWRRFEKGFFEELWEDYDRFCELPEALIGHLRDHVPLFPLRCVSQSEAADGTLKLLFETSEGLKLESVLMRYGGEGKPERYSVCVSSQVGCPARCAFCATGTMKWGRNLRSDEILAQVLWCNRWLKARGQRVQNLVFMGMGEPLLNCDQVFTAIKALLDQRKFSLGPRRITLSTVGIVPGLERLLASGLPIRLAVSLHAPTDTLRSYIVPINKSYPLDVLMPVLDRWTAAHDKQIVYEYVMLRDLNDGQQQAAELTRLLAGRRAYVNLIPYNPGPGQFELHPSPRERIYAFAERLRAGGIRTIVRHTFGRDIAAACGQLAVNS